MVHQAGTILKNRYRIAKPLAQGGFGAVYRAWDMSLNKPCALKQNLNLTLQGQRQFKHEAMILAKLTHTNLPRVSDHFSLQGQGQYLVMDFIDGQDLDNLMQHQGIVPEKQAIEWVSQIADALTYLHKQPSPIIHRDIKPANIRLASDGRVVLVDFGLVKVYDPKLQTTVGAHGVTHGYSPPEQYSRAQTDARTDIYALGATLYKLLTGKDPQGSVLRSGHDTMPLAHQVNPQVTPEIGQIVQRAMNLDPMQRYQTADEFKIALNAPRFVPTLPITPRPIPARIPPVNPNPSPLPPTTFLTNQSNTTTSRNQKPLSWLMGIGLVVIVGIAGIWMLQQKTKEFAIAEIHATATIQSKQTATAYAQQMANAEAEQTATAEVEARAALQALLTATVQAQAQATAQAERTAIAQARVAATAQAEQAKATATAQARTELVSAIEARRRREFGPENGSLRHDNDGFISITAASVKVKDFMVEARFFNPYSYSVESWDYGFLFRNEGNDEFRLIIHSRQTWNLYYRSKDNDNLIDNGNIPNLDISTDGSNRVKLISQENKGLLYINDEFIVEFDLSADTNSGDVRIATGMYEGNEIDGEVTIYKDFTVWSIP